MTNREAMIQAHIDLLFEAVATRWLERDPEMTKRDEEMFVLCMVAMTDWASTDGATVKFLKLCEDLKHGRKKGIYCLDWKLRQ